MNYSFLKSAIAALMIAGLFLSSYSFAQDKTDKKIIKKDVVISKDEPEPGHLKELMNLSPEQEKAIKQLHLKTIKIITPLKNQIQEKKAHLKTLSSVDNPDMNAINVTIDEMSALKAQMIKVHLNQKMEVRKILNEEQRIIFDSKPCKGMGQGCSKFKCCGMGKACGMGCSMDCCGMGCGKGPGCGMGPGCCMGQGCGMGLGFGLGMGQGKGMGKGCGMGQGNSMGPRMGKGLNPDCPYHKQIDEDNE